MRTVKASEVVKGMRVRFEASNGGATVTTEGVISEVSGEYAVSAWFGDYGINLNPDHPVTVLAEPEPEWVEGAWYRCRVHITSDGVKTLRRCVNGWTSFEQGTASYGDDLVTVLGRVLIVDWPGDQLAKDLTDGASISRDWESLADLIADAIRTQGGVR